LPTSFPFRDFVESGALTSYGTDTAAAYRELGAYVGRILKCTKPTELPVAQVSKFEAINHQTARTLAIKAPVNLLAITDEVIE
jgi:putative tryptophan/tyrosine transport system substrate-binding protein